MAFFYILPVILLVIFIASFILAIMETIQLEYSNFSIPPEVNHPGKLRIVLAFMTGTSAMACNLMGDCHGFIFSCASFLVKTKPEQPLKILEKTGVRSQIAFTRYVCSGRKLGPDPQLRPGADSHGKICRYIARISESVVVSGGYRSAPEHKYPAVYEDCLNATTHFMKNIEDCGVDPARIIVCGESDKN